MGEKFDPKLFDIHKNYVIEASAGTGKTYNVVEIVRKLIAAGVPLDKLLIVTYTEKAAGELKSRIREGLKNCDETNKERFSEQLKKLDSASIGTIHSFCQKAIEEFCIASGKPSNLQLIDEGDCSAFIDRYIREGEIYKEICQIKNDIPDKSIESSLKTKIIALPKQYYLNNAYQEDEAIVRMQKEEEFDQETEAFEPSESAELYVYGKCALDAAFPELKGQIAIFEASSCPAAAAFIAELKQTEFLEAVDQHKINEFNGFKNEKGAFREIKKIREQITDAQKAKVKREEKQEKEQEKERKDLKKRLNRLVTKYSKEIYRAWQEEKEKHARQTYNDMLRNVREEVIKPNSILLKRLKDKYQAAIIDEFQDTNQKQWDIFRRIFLYDYDGKKIDKNHTIIVVGDPKQSIYAFQGADLNVYRKAIDEIISLGGNERQLTENYRATTGIIDSTNQFFGSNHANPMAGMSDETGTTDVPKFVESTEPVKGGSRFKVKYDGDEETKAFWIQTDKGDDYPLLVCQTILDCCRQKKNRETKLRLYGDQEDKQWRNVFFSDFAVLARTRSELQPIKEAFEKCGIPYVQYKEDSLLNGRECASWAAVLEAVDVSDFSGKNRAVFKKAMHTSFFDKSLLEISSPYYDKDNIEEVVLFHVWGELAKEKHWETLIDRIMDDTRVEERLGSPKDIRTLGVLRQIGEYCIDYLTNNSSLTLLVKNLKKHLSGNNDEEAVQTNDNIVAKSTEFGCVKIMTIHASKGLEFPVVISAAGSKGQLPVQFVNIFGYHDFEGRYKLSFKNPSTYDEEACAEWKRLIYVDYTRAKYVLMLPNFQSLDAPYSFIADSINAYKEAPKGEYRELACESGRGWEILEQEAREILSGEKKEETVSEKEAGSKSSPSRSITKEEQKGKIKKLKDEKGGHCSYKRAYSSLSHGKQKEETMTDDALTVDNEDEKVKKPEREDLSRFDQNNVVRIKCEYDESQGPDMISKDFPAGADLGNALHDIFELIDYRKAAVKEASEPDDDFDACIENCLKAYGIKCPDTWKKDIREMIRNVLNAKLPGIQGGKEVPEESFTLGDIDWPDRKNEVEFNFRYDDAVVNYFNGFVDLIIKRGDYYSVLDWKSDRIKEGTEFTAYNKADEVQRHVDGLYSIQRVLYSYTLIKWLKNFYPSLTEQEIFEKHFGGVYYVFLRGCNEGGGNGIYAQTWKSWQDIEDAYRNIVQKRIFGAKDEKTDPGKTGTEAEGITEAKEADHE